MATKFIKPDTTNISETAYYDSFLKKVAEAAPAPTAEEPDSIRKKLKKYGIKPEMSFGKVIEQVLINIEKTHNITSRVLIGEQTGLHNSQINQMVKGTVPEKEDKLLKLIDFASLDAITHNFIRWKRREERGYSFQPDDKITPTELYRNARLLKDVLIDELASISDIKRGTLRHREEKDDERPIHRRDALKHLNALSTEDPANLPEFTRIKDQLIKKWKEDGGYTFKDSSKLNSKQLFLNMRIDRDLTLPEAEKATGVAFSNLHQWEEGRSEPRYITEAMNTIDTYEPSKEQPDHADIIKTYNRNRKYAIYNLLRSFDYSFKNDKDISTGELLSNMRILKGHSGRDASGISGVASTTLVNWENNATPEHKLEILKQVEYYAPSETDKYYEQKLKVYEYNKELFTEKLLKKLGYSFADDKKITLGALLKNMRIDNGLTKDGVVNSDIVKDFGISLSALTDWENGQIPKTNERGALLKLIKFYGASESTKYEAQKKLATNKLLEEIGYSFTNEKSITFGQCLKNMRLLADKSQESAGAHIGVSGTAISLWESGTAPLNKIEDIAKLLQFYKPLPEFKEHFEGTASLDQSKPDLHYDYKKLTFNKFLERSGYHFDSDKDITFDKLLANMRIKVGKTVEEIGNLTGLNSRSIAGWENGVLPAPDKILTLLNAYKPSANVENHFDEGSKFEQQKILLIKKWLEVGYKRHKSTAYLLEEMLEKLKLEEKKSDSYGSNKKAEKSPFSESKLNDTSISKNPKPKTNILRSGSDPKPAAKSEISVDKELAEYREMTLGKLLQKIRFMAGIYHPEDMQEKIGSNNINSFKIIRWEKGEKPDSLGNMLLMIDACAPKGKPREKELFTKMRDLAIVKFNNFISEDRSAEQTEKTSKTSRPYRISHRDLGKRNDSNYFSI